MTILLCIPKNQQTIDMAELVCSIKILSQLRSEMICHFFMHFCPGTITTHAESISSDLQRGLDRRLRHIQH